MRRIITIALLVVVAAGCARPSVEDTFDEISRGLEDTDSGPCRKEVIYRVTGTAQGVDLTITNGSGNTEQLSDRAVPLKTTSGREGLSIGQVECGEFVYISAQNTGESGSVKCAIEVDGGLIETAESEGAYVIASCSGTVPG